MVKQEFIVLFILGSASCFTPLPQYLANSPGLTFCYPDSKPDVLSLARLTVEVFGAEVSLAPNTFEGFRVAEPIFQAGVTFWNTYINGVAEIDVLTGMLSRVGKARLASPSLELNDLRTPPESSLLFSIVDDQSNAAVAMVELRLQQTDGKIPFTQPGESLLFRLLTLSKRACEPLLN